MEVDQVHSLIERASKKKTTMKIITPWDWKQVMRSTGSEVIDMNLNDFKNYGCLYSSTNSCYVQPKKNTDDENFLISKVVAFKISVEEPNLVYYKTSFDDTRFKSLNIQRPNNPGTLPQELSPLNSRPIGISLNKYNHLLKSLTWVPQQFHSFFKNLPKNNKKKDIDEQ